MRSTLLEPLVGIITLLLFAANLVFWCTPFYVVAFFKFIIPIKRWRLFTGDILVKLAEHWIEGNRVIAALHNIEWDVEGNENLERQEWYLVTCNHQSWSDIFVTQQILNRRIPFLKYFIKKQLIWIPLLGLAWWALDLPFMKRHSREFLERHPERRNEDMETTRRACEHFRHTPTTIINFAEGTRFTPAKHDAQQSPYKHLLKPKAGGLAFVLSAMNGTITTLLDVTVVYPQPGATFWDLVCGRIDRIIVRVQKYAIPETLLHGDYLNDPEYKARFQNWISSIWESKDALIDSLVSQNTHSA